MMSRHLILLYWTILLIPLLFTFEHRAKAELVSAPSPTVDFEIVNGKKIYTITGVRLNDNPKVITAYNSSGESIMDVYNRGNMDALAAHVQYLTYNYEMNNFLKQHTGWSGSVDVYFDGEGWKREYRYSTKDGFLGSAYSYNEVSEAMAQLSYLFDADLQQAIQALDKDAKVFTIATDSRDQTVRVESLPEGGVYVPGDAKTNPVAGDKFVLYYNNDVYVDVQLEVPCDGECDPPPPVQACQRDYITERNGEVKKREFVVPNPSGEIISDSGEFDVELGIPSSEYNRTDARSEEYLFTQNFTQRIGRVDFDNIQSRKTYTFRWRCGKRMCSSTQTFYTNVGIVKRPFSYWNVLDYNVWKLENSVFRNYSLPNEKVTIPSKVVIEAGANHLPDVKKHVFPDDCPTIEEMTLPSVTVAGPPYTPNFDAEALARAEREIAVNQVENDYVDFKQQIMMDKKRVPVNGPTPKDIPYPGMIEMSKRNLLIDPEKTNYWRSPSTGEVNYMLIFSLKKNAANLKFPFAVNVVTVHTPTVMYPKASDDKEHDQRTDPPNRSTPANPDKDRHAFILDRTFTVTMPTSGQHREIPGYGNKDYIKYIKEKQVKFPFDVYTETKMGYFPANTWIPIPLDIESPTFSMPVWVPEGEYTIHFRSFAINAPKDGRNKGSSKPPLTDLNTKHSTEVEANVTIPNPKYNIPPAGTDSAAHVAVDTIEVDVVGRLYDFRVTDVSDYNWQYVFQEMDGWTLKGNSYWVGLNGIDGDARGNEPIFTLPIRQGSHTKGYKNLAVKKGYTFRFNFKTKGTMFRNNDAIRIKPTFYFVNKNGTGRQEIDLYYHKDRTNFVRVGDVKDTVYRNVKLNLPARRVSKNELLRTGQFYSRHAETYGFEEAAEDYPSADGFARYYERFISKKKVATGPYGWQIVNWRLRTFRGPMEDAVPAITMVPQKDIVAREQTWYSEYSIPANVYAVRKNTNIAALGMLGRLNENHPIFLRDGYIIVNFDIETIQDGNLEKPHLQYIHAENMNQWYDMEGFKRSFTDPYGNQFFLKDGDVVFYHGDASSTDDFAPSVTH